MFFVYACIISSYGNILFFVGHNFEKIYPTFSRTDVVSLETLVSSTGMKYVWLQCDFELTDQLSGICGLGAHVSEWCRFKNGRVVIWWGNAKHLQLFLIRTADFSFCINLLHTWDITLVFILQFQPPPARWGYWCDLSGVALWSTHHFAGRGDSFAEQICTLRCNLKLWEGGFRVGQTAVIGSASPPGSQRLHLLDTP